MFEIIHTTVIITITSIMIFFIADLWFNMNKERKQEFVKCRIENERPKPSLSDGMVTPSTHGR